MKTIKCSALCNSIIFFVVPALSLALSATISRASPLCSRFSVYSNLAFKAPEVQRAAITEWLLDKTVGNVDFYYSITVCNEKKVVYLKFNNKNSYAVKVTWKEVFLIHPGESKEGFMGKKELALSPGITAPIDCFDATNRKSIILPSEIDPTAVNEILGFSFKEITVNTQ